MRWSARNLWTIYRKLHTNKYTLVQEALEHAQPHDNPWHHSCAYLFWYVINPFRLFGDMLHAAEGSLTNVRQTGSPPEHVNKAILGVLLFSPCFILWFLNMNLQRLNEGACAWLFWVILLDEHVGAGAIHSWSNNLVFWPNLISGTNWSKRSRQELVFLSTGEEQLDVRSVCWWECGASVKVGNEVRGHDVISCLGRPSMSALWPQHLSDPFEWSHSLQRREREDY